MEDEKVRVSTRRNPSFWDSTEHVEETYYGKSMGSVGSVCFFFQETISRKLGHPGSLDYFEFTLFMDGVLPSYRIKKSNMLCVCTLPSGYLTLPWYRWPIEIEILPIKIGDFPWLC